MFNFTASPAVTTASATNPPVGQPFCFSTPMTNSTTPPALFSFATPATTNNALTSLLTAPATQTSSFSFGATTSIAPTSPVSSITSSIGTGLGGIFAPPSTTTISESIGKPKESSDPTDPTLPPQLNDSIDQFIKMLAESEEHLSDMEHTSTSEFVNVQEQLGRIEQNLLDIQSDVKRDEATFAEINQTYQQELYNATICKYLRSLSSEAEIEDRVVDNYLMQKVVEIKVHHKQCQDALDCAERHLQRSDLVATAKNAFARMISAASNANQTHKLVEDIKSRLLGH